MHLRIKEVTEYTGPETYVRDMLAKNDFGFFPILKTSSIIVEDVSNEVTLTLILTITLTLTLTLVLTQPLPLPLNPNQVLQDRIQALHQQAERHAERIEAQLEAQRSEMLELQRDGGEML